MAKKRKKYTEAVGVAPEICFQLKLMLFAGFTFFALFPNQPASIYFQRKTPIHNPYWTGRSSK